MNWSFSDLFDETRKEKLSEDHSFSEIITNVFNNLEVLCCHKNNCSDNTSFNRIIYTISIPKDVFDIFFNSFNGYRGEYYKSPFKGIKSNHYFIGKIKNKLLEAQCTKSLAQKEPSNEFINQSLSCLSAKCWLCETGTELCELCVGEWRSNIQHTTDILNGRWEKSESALAKYGSHAPYFTKLKIFGGFVDNIYNEFTPARKRQRANEIYKFGWS